MKRTGTQRGFTLMEMMVAIAVLAVALLAITSAQQSSVNSAFRVQRAQTAALLMKGLILDIEEEYKIEGFPENSIEDRDCEVPDDFDDMFECRYSLMRLDLQPEQMQQLVDQSFGGLLGAGGIESLMSGNTADLSGTMENLLNGEQEAPGAVDMSGMAFLMPFFGPEGQALLNLCNINLSMLVMGLMGIQSFVPMVLQEVSNKTRKLTVKLEWQEGPFGDRDFSITTYITSLPEEQLMQMKNAEDAQEVLEGAGVIPPTGGATGTGGTGTGGRGTGGRP